MSQTHIGVNSPQAQKLWGAFVNKQLRAASYFSKKFIEPGPRAVIEEKTELSQRNGDTVYFDLLNALKEDGVAGDANIEGTEEALSYHQDSVMIDQWRKGVVSAGEMSEQRTIHNTRKNASDNLGLYFAAWHDELIFNQLAGQSPVGALNADSRFKSDPRLTVGFAGNAYRPPDPDHHLFSGEATSLGSMVATDTMSIDTVERCVAKCEMHASVDDRNMQMNPVVIEGGEHFALLMSPWDEYYMRDLAKDGQWAKIYRDYTAAEGYNKNPIMRGGVGMISNCVLHKHSRTRRYGGAGAGANLPYSRSLFLGAQAGVIAYGLRNKRGRVRYTEKRVNADNATAFYGALICGAQATEFNGRRFGSMVVDSHCPDPNA